MLKSVIQSVALMLTAQALCAAERPNVLWLVSEDNTTLLGCYGDPLAKTPVLDKLASEGVLYENCFAQPVCAPSRFTLITGTPAVSSGPANHMRAAGKIPAQMKGFPTYLRAAGYYTANNSKTDYNSPIDLVESWDESGETAHYRNRAVGQSFFSVFNFFTTHESCLFPEISAPLTFTPTDPAKIRIPAYQPDTPEMRADWARYYDQLRLLDEGIGAQLKALADAGLADNTIVFYYSDNGGVLPRSKRFLQRSGTHVPLIVYFPPKWRHLAPAAPGSRIKEPVCFADFAPTVLSLAGVNIPDYIQGRAFAGPKVRANDFVFCSRDRMDERYDMMRSVMDSRWLYIRNFRPDRPYVQPLSYMFRARGYRSWARLAREGGLTPATSMFWGEKPTEELYDMVADPDNLKNLAANPAHTETLARVRAALRRHTLEIVDNGFIPEGSSLEGYEASRHPGAYPVDMVYDLAALGSERDPANLPIFIKALTHPCEPMRWWAAQGCAMLRDEAVPAEAALRIALADESGAVQVAAAEALARLGHLDAALPVLENWIQQIQNPPFALQAANVLDHLKEAARPALPAVKAALIPANRNPGFVSKDENYLVAMLTHIADVLEGRKQPLVYPAATTSAPIR